MPALASITPSAFIMTSSTRAHEPSASIHRTGIAERADQLADVRRGASLSDVRVEVNVAHTTSRLRARFFVEMRHVDAAGVVDSKWGFGVFMAEVTCFESQLLRLIKKHSCATINGESGTLVKQKTSANCAMCAALKREMKLWTKLSGLQAFGKRHMDAKCARVAAFLYKLLRLVHQNAHWLHTCELLRDVLRRTEELCRLQYPNDSDAVCVIEALKRVPSLQQLTTTRASASALAIQEDCSICLSSLHCSTAGTGTTNKDASIESAPARVGVELLCGHRFHDTCICLWFRTRLNCPICRTHAIQEDAEDATSS